MLLYSMLVAYLVYLRATDGQLEVPPFHGKGILGCKGSHVKAVCTWLK